MDAGANEPSNLGVVFSAGASTLGCMTVETAALTECTVPVLGLAAAERNQGRSLIESA